MVNKTGDDDIHISWAYNLAAGSGVLSYADTLEPPKISVSPLSFVTWVRMRLSYHATFAIGAAFAHLGGLLCTNEKDVLCDGIVD